LIVFRQPDVNVARANILRSKVVVALDISSADLPYDGFEWLELENDVAGPVVNDQAA